MNITSFDQIQYMYIISIFNQWYKTTADPLTLIRRPPTGNHWVRSLIRLSVMLAYSIF